MREHHLHRLKWLLITLCISIETIHCESQNQQWSKPEQSLSRQNNDWIPVQGKCPTCRPNRDLDTQSTNEQIGKVLTPPRSPNLTPAPPPQQQVQFIQNKQPRILPFGLNYPLYNNPFASNDNKQYQIQSTKLFPQETQKPFFQYDGNPFAKQPYTLPPQGIPQQQQQSIPQQRFPLNEPYPFTLPLKGADSTTPKVNYQPKIRFPDNEPPKIIPNNKITSQSTDEIQLLYVPVETLQRGRKNMKELFNQNQYQPQLPQGFISPQFNLQYSPVPKQPEGQFFFQPNLPQAQPYLQLNQLPPPRPELVYTNISKNFLQPYFTIYNPVSQIPTGPVPTKQPDLQFYNILQPGLFNPNQVKIPEQLFKTQQVPSRQPLPVQQQSLAPPQGAFLQNTIPSFADVYSPTTTPEVTRSTEFTTEKATYKTMPSAGKFPEFNYQYVTTSPQTSASQSQQYVAEQNKLPSLNQQFFAEQNKISSQKPNPSDFTQSSQPSRTPQLKTTAFDEPGNPNYPVPHQPPLSFYMEKLHNPKVNDVLYLLKDAKTIPVLDTVENEPPQVFVGPSELPPPKGYIKFELPYLSSLDYNRIERMIDRLPFFVAPLNFKPPPGYSKIPFPAPHIGSVVLSNTSALHESLHEKPYDQKYKASTVQPFSASPELSTITPQLTSQINSLVDTQSPISSNPASFQNFVPASDPVTFRNYPASSSEPVTYRNYPTPSSDPVTFKNYPSPTEDVTKKPIFKNTYRPSTTTEQPKRNNNRQRKPIYRGYPTSTETTTAHRVFTTTTTTTTEPSQKFYSEPIKDTDNYVEFNAKAKFNINNGNENALPSNPPTPENTYQPPVTTTTSTQPPPTEPQKNSFDFSSFFSNFQGELSQTQTPQNANVLESQRPTQNIDFYSTNNQNPQNYPFYSSQSSTDVRSDSVINQVNNTESEANGQPNFNFNNVKPLSQYNPFSKNEESSIYNITELAPAKPTDQQNEFQFWNQNQFYKVNPSTVDYFSSTADYQTPEASTLPPEVRTRPQKTTTSTYTPESNFVFDLQKQDQIQVSYSSTELPEQTTATTHRPRPKQRLHPSRYHQFKLTTEKENIDYQPQKNNDDRLNTRLPLAPIPENTFESSTHSDVTSQSDVVSQSTESQELSTRSDIKHRRRRPIRPTQANIVTPATEQSSSTSRSYYRTRATRYPTGSATERYRARRPTTSSESTETLNSEWSSYNFAPSAPASNEITNPVDNQPRVSAHDENNNDANSPNYWPDSVSIQQNQAVDMSSSTETYARSTSEESSTEISPWVPSKQSSLPGEYSIYTPPAQNQQFLVDESVENKTENVVERRDETYNFDTKNSLRGSPKTTLYEEPSSSTTTGNNEHYSSEEPSYASEKNYDQDIKKEKFLAKEGADGQKKAYDPQDEKKVPGRRRGTWVRRIRIKRPQDVFETAESQNLGRITENALQNSDSKTLSKTEEKEDFKPKISSTTSSPNDLAPSTDSITEKEEVKVTTLPPPTTTMAMEKDDDYANLQNNFAQMLSDFLNSNDQATKSVNNLERSNVSTENSISYILGLDSKSNNDYSDNSSSSTNAPSSSTEKATTTFDELVTITNLPISNTEFPEHTTSTEETSETYIPNRLVATSTTTEISLETEICYRGKCVKTKKSKASDLLPVE